MNQYRFSLVWEPNVEVRGVVQRSSWREEKLWPFLYHLVLDSISAIRLRPKTHMRLAMLCRSLNNSVWFRFDWNVQYYFVSIRKTFIDNCWGLGLNIFLGMKLFFLKLVLFSCFALDFILRNFLLTHIGIVILTNKKYFLHRALLFSL